MAKTPTGLVYCMYHVLVSY